MPLVDRLVWDRSWRLPSRRLPRTGSYPGDTWVLVFGMLSWCPESSIPLKLQALRSNQSPFWLQRIERIRAKTKEIMQLHCTRLLNFGLNFWGRQMFLPLWVLPRKDNQELHYTMGMEFNYSLAVMESYKQCFLKTSLNFSQYKNNKSPQSKPVEWIEEYISRDDSI